MSYWNFNITFLTTAKELVWSGSHLISGDRPTFDFKLVTIDGQEMLTVLLLPYKHSDRYPAGAGLVINTSLKVTGVVQGKPGLILDMHEFNVMENGSRALMLSRQPYHRQYDHALGFVDTGPLRSIGNPGFVEIDVSTGNTTFEWWAANHIDPRESFNTPPSKPEATWDWLHLNSVDKNAQGDYLVSGRYTNTIYKISGRDGSIIWRLGGALSSFKTTDTNFTGQHDARFQPCDLAGQFTTCLSLLNNGASDIDPVATGPSAGILVGLDEKAMVAVLRQVYRRPDNQTSSLRGNMQVVPTSGNIAVKWSDNGYMSEFTADGVHILDVQFASHRFTTYRGYKFNLTLSPTDSPACKIHVYGDTTVFYASWNGATKVSWWNFYGSNATSSPAPDSASTNLFDDPQRHLEPPKANSESRSTDIRQHSAVGQASRSGFETVFVIQGRLLDGYAEAVAADGTILGRSELESAISNTAQKRHKKVHHGLNLHKNDSPHAVALKSNNTAEPLQRGRRSPFALSDQRLRATWVLLAMGVLILVYRRHIRTWCWARPVSFLASGRRSEPV